MLRTAARLGRRRWERNRGTAQSSEAVMRTQNILGSVMRPRHSSPVHVTASPLRHPQPTGRDRVVTGPVLPF